MLFVKFASFQKRDAAIQVFNALQSKFSDKLSFMNPDLPLQERIQNIFLSNFKRLLVSWQFPKTSVKYETSEHILEVAKKQVLKVQVVDSKFEVVWTDKSWETWKECVEDSEYQKLVSDAQGRLTEAMTRDYKGKGEGASA